MKKLYNLTIEGMKNKQDIEDFLTEVNYCEFCNNERFSLELKSFDYNEESNEGECIVYVSCDEDTCIKDALYEMVNCEFCCDFSFYGDSIGSISIGPIKEN